MQHFVFSAQSQDPAPSAGGTLAGWLMYYKWDVGGDTFLPFQEKDLNSLPAKGDLLWIALDGYISAVFVVTSSSTENGQDVVEVHYNTDTRQNPPQGSPIFPLKAATGVVSDEETLGKLLEYKRQLDAMYPARM